MPDHAIADDGARIAFAERGTGVPVLLIAGQATGMHGWGPFADALTPLAQARLLAEAIPHATLRSFDAGHGLHLDTPEVREAVRSFLLPAPMRRGSRGLGMRPRARSVSCGGGG